MLFRRDVVCGSKIENAHTSSSGGFSLPVLLVGGLSTLALIFTVPIAWNSLTSPNQAQAQEISPEPTLAETFSKIFTVNIPASFRELVTMAALEVEGETLFGGSVTFAGGSVFDGQITLQGDVFADGINIDLGSGEITASNVLYSLTEGDGIDISTGQTPTITNSDRGSSQNIFKKVKLGDDNIEADSNTDTLEFAAGSGISLSIDTSNDKLTISNSSIPGFTTSGTYAVLSSGITRAGIGTSTPSNTLEVNSGTTDTSGITFTQLTSSSAAGVGGGKVLSVDSGGKIILVTDQTGSTPTAESVLPSATNGMTLYFNGTNWVASDNLFHDGGSVGISNAAPTSRFQVNTNLASKIGVIVQGYTSQTANLQEWRDSSGSILSYIDSNGVFNGSANTSGSLNPGFTTGSVAFQGASGLTQDNSNFFWDDTNNRLGIGTAAPTSVVEIPARANTVSLKVGSQTATTGSPDVLQVIGSSGVGLRVSSDGGVSLATGCNAVNGSTNCNVGVLAVYGTGAPARVVQHIRGTTSQTADILQVANSSSQMFFNVAAIGNVGIGTATPFSKLHVEGLTTNAIGLFNQTGSGDILTASASGTTRMVLTSAGNLGIGTSTPTAPLEVNGIVRATQVLDGSYSSAGNYFIKTDKWIMSGASVQANNFLADGNSNTGLFLSTGSSGYAYLKTNNTEQLRVNNTGNVGIGTTSPISKLHAEGLTTNAIGLFKQTGSGDILTASSSGTTRLVLTNAGNLGLGTTTPTEKLHIVTPGFDAAIRLSNSTNTSRYLTLTADQNGASMSFDSLLNFIVGSTLEWRIGATALESRDGGVIFNSSGTVSAPSYSFLADQNSGLYYTGTNDNIGLVTTGTERIRIDNNGNIGIGTTTPTSKLHVEGLYGANALARFNQTGTGDILTASASGTTRMVLTNAGNLGLGTNLPTVGLTLIKDVGNAGAQKHNALASFTQSGSTSDGVSIGYYSRTASALEGGSVISNTSSNYLYLGINSGTTPLMRVGGSQVYIGTTATPNLGQLLTIEGGVSVSGSGTSITESSSYASIYGANLIPGVGVTGDLVLQSRNTIGQNGIVLVTGQGGAAAIRTTVTYDGQVGIGTITPSSVLHVEAPTGAALARFNQTGTGDILTASASGTTRLRIQNSGETWIGTTADLGFSTTSMLDVNGTIGLPSSGVLIASGGNGVLGRTGNIFYFQAPGSGNFFQLRNNSGTELINVDNSGNFGIGTTTFGTSAAKVLAIAGSTAPSTAITDGIQMFAVDQAGSHELRVMDEAGNTTTLSPHNFSVIGDQSEEMAWSFYSERNSLAINADMTKALRLVEKLSGEKLVYLKDLESGFLLEDASDATHLTELADNGTIGEIARWNYQLWTYVGEVIFEKPVTFLADVRLKGRIFLSADQVGTVTIPAGSRSAKITFSRELPVKPILNVTPHQSLPNGITLTEITTQHFTLTLPDPLDHDVNINWLASLKNSNDLSQPNIEILSTTPSPLPSPSPAPSSSPLPTSEPASSSSATIETSPVATQSAQTAQ